MSIFLDGEKWNSPEVLQLLSDKLQNLIDKFNHPSWITPICVKRISLPSMPELVICNIEDMDRGDCASSTALDNVNVLCDVFMDGPILIEFSTCLIVNYPSKSFMEMPVLIRLVHATLDGSLIVRNMKESIAISLLDNFKYDFAFESELGDKTVLKNADKIELLMLEQLKTYISNNLVFPLFKQFNKPQKH